jgi:hypothetical protein
MENWLNLKFSTSNTMKFWVGAYLNWWMKTAIMKSALVSMEAYEGIQILIKRTLTQDAVNKIEKHRDCKIADFQLYAGDGTEWAYGSCFKRPI